MFCEHAKEMRGAGSQGHGGRVALALRCHQLTGHSKGRLLGAQLPVFNGQATGLKGDRSPRPFPALRAPTWSY